MSKTSFSALFDQSIGSFITPTALRHEAIEEADVLRIGGATVLEAPGQDFLIRTAFQNALSQGFKAHAEQGADAIIKGAFAFDETQVITVGKLAITGLKPDFIDDATKDHDAADHVARRT